NNAPRGSQASDQPPPSRSDDSSNSAPPAANDTTNAVATTDAPGKSGVKSDATKSSDNKSTDKSSTDATSKAGDASDQGKPADAQTAAQNPIAALIPIVTGPANPPANANAPLA